MLGSSEQKPPVEELLRVSNLSVSFDVTGRRAEAISGVDFSILRGKTLGLVGESGSGKSVTSLAVMQLLDSRISTVSGSVKVEERELLGLTEKEMQQVRGNDIAMIFQEPMTSLNPVYTVGNQITEALLVHRPVGINEAISEAVRVLDDVGIAEARSMLSVIRMNSRAG